MKLIFLSVTGVMLLHSMMQNVLLLVSDAGWIAITSISASFFSLVGLVVVALINKKVNTVKESIDGLLKEKSKADEDIGRVRELERAEKEKAIGDSRELEIRKEQDLINQPPPNSNTAKTDVQDVKDQIEKEIHRQGDKIQDVVKDKVEEIKKEVPEVTSDKVVEKLDPKK